MLDAGGGDAHGLVPNRLLPRQEGHPRSGEGLIEDTQEGKTTKWRYRIGTAHIPVHTLDTRAT